MVHLSNWLHRKSLPLHSSNKRRYSALQDIQMVLSKACRSYVEKSVFFKFTLKCVVEI